jgi:hypothetical protein
MKMFGIGFFTGSRAVIYFISNRKNMFGNGSTGIIASAHLFGSLPSYLIG